MIQAAAAADAASKDNSRDAIVQATIREISHIATLPEVTMKIIQLVEDPDSTAQDLNKVISNDPALGARILKVVNSAFYGLPGRIGSTDRAIVLLGLNAVKNIAIAASLAKLFRGGQICPSFDARDLWQHSIAVATTTRLLSAKAGLCLPDEAFLAGLIHDIGIMVEIQAKRAQFVKALTKVQQDPSVTLREAETEFIGANHEDLGTGLCKQWKFPASFAYVTGYHHRPMEINDKQRGLVCLVHVADVMAANLNLGFTQTVETKEYQAEILEVIRLTGEQLEQISKQVPEAMKEAMGLLQSEG